MATSKPPNPDFQSPRSTSGGSAMTPPTARATTRSTPGRKGMAPVAAVGKVRTTKGGDGIAPPEAEVPSSEFIDPIPTRPSDTFKPKKAG